MGEITGTGIFNTESTNILWELEESIGFVDAINEDMTELFVYDLPQQCKLIKFWKERTEAARLLDLATSKDYQDINKIVKDKFQFF